MDINLGGLTNKIKKNAFSIVVIVIALFLSKKIYDGQMNKVVALKSNIDIELKKSEEIKNIAKLEKKLSFLKDTINKKNMSKLINKISTLAKSAEVTIASIKPQKEKSFVSYVAYPFDVTVTADNYHAIGNFVKLLETSEDIFMIDSLSIKQSWQARASKSNRPSRIMAATLRLNTILISD